MEKIKMTIPLVEMDGDEWPLFCGGKQKKN